jgi:hypothetical protein
VRSRAFLIGLGLRVSADEKQPGFVVDVVAFYWFLDIGLA